MRRGQIGNVDADHGLAQTARCIRQFFGVVVERGCLHDGLSACLGVSGFEDAGADEYAVRAQLHHHGGVGGGCHATGGKHDHGQLTGLRNFEHQVVGGGKFFRLHVQLVGHGVVQALQLGDLALNGADMLGCLRDVTGASLTLRTDHGRTLGDTAQCLAQVGGAAYERHRELVLVNVVHVIGGGEHL